MTRLKKLSKIFISGEWLVFWIALALRAIRPGLYPPFSDELVSLNSAADIVFQSQWTWIGNPVSWSGISYHSPLSNYLMAIPFLFGRNPMFVRLFIAFWSALTGIAIMRLVQRYVDKEAALIAGLLFAVLPQMVDWGRFVWNPNFATLWIILWIHTMLSGYLDGKRGQQMMHWLFLSLCFQMQAALLILVPMSLIATVIWHWKNHTLRDFIYTILSLSVFAISLIPWGIGLIQMNVWTADSSSSSVQIPDFGVMLWQIAHVVGGYNLKFYRFDYPPVILSPGLLIYSLSILAGICIAIHKRMTAALIWVAIGIAGFGFYPVVNREGVADHYLMTSVLVAILLASIGFSFLIKRHKKIGLTVFSIAWMAQLCLSLLHLHYFTLDKSLEYTPLRNMNTIHHQMLSWHQDAPIIFLRDNPEFNEATFWQQWEWLMLWKLYEKFGWLRVVDAGESLPVPAEGAIIVGDRDGYIQYFVDVESLPVVSFEAGTTATRLTYADFSPADIAPPQILPLADNSFYGVMNVEGITINDGFILLQWQSFQTSPTESYHFVLERDNQVLEVLSLPSYQWQSGEFVLTLIEAEMTDSNRLTLSLRRESDRAFVPVSTIDNPQTQMHFEISP